MTHTQLSVTFFYENRPYRPIYLKNENYVSVIDGTLKADLDYDLFIDDSPLNAEKFLENNKNNK